MYLESTFCVISFQNLIFRHKYRSKVVGEITVSWLHKAICLSSETRNKISMVLNQCHFDYS